IALNLHILNILVLTSSFVGWYASMFLLYTKNSTQYQSYILPLPKGKKSLKKFPNPSLRIGLVQFKGFGINMTKVDKNHITGTDLEAILEAKVKKKSNISLYDKCKIPESNKHRTY
ncbi:13280_t:CDS:1, partial [Gigaspora margarita]